MLWQTNYAKAEVFAALRVEDVVLYLIFELESIRLNGRRSY